MKMIKSGFVALSVAALMAGCASNDVAQGEEVMLSSDSFLGACDNPTVAEGATFEDVLYVVGDFPDAGWKHKPHRAMSYKGDNTYQLVVDEVAGTKKLQYAAVSWSPQFTAYGQSLDVGVEGRLKRGGFAKDTRVTIPQDGKYVWSISFDEQGEPAKAMVALCK